ncbi:hypothetical protein M9H77_16645 [Catharanthus roseus]|uniref:Uncharacterized protein n=1 Tax=Catharanthus roseus TaxID=4058 RepID=A0ACC0B2B3_CATRO|nr:hypothetical protein M9H77_16645 [Catharanthus roseus]
MTYCSSIATTTMAEIHSDIVQTHILTRLDGPTLASFSSASSDLHTICKEEIHWKNLCNSNWPSTKDPSLQQIISQFPSGHRSFFSDSYPTVRRLHHRRRKNTTLSEIIPQTSELISAVDIHYENRTIYSKVDKTAIGSIWCRSTPFRIDLLGVKEVVRTPLKFDFEDETCTARTEKNMTLSWIVIDPVKKRTVNLSSLRPVEIRQQLKGEINIHFATIIGDGIDGRFVKCGVDVTCERVKDDDVLNITEIGMQVEDMEGNILNGNDSLEIFEEAMESKRIKATIGEEKKMYNMFMLWRDYFIHDQL